MALEGIEVRELAERDRVLDAVARALRHGETAQQVGVRLVEAAHEPQRHAETDRELHGHVALRRLRTRLLERGLDQRQRGGPVAAIDLDLGLELARQLGLTAGANTVRELERVPIELLGAVQLAAATGEHAERELGAGLAGAMRDLARDAQRLPEVLVGEIPLPEAIADEPQVLMVAAHAAEQSAPLVKLQRLLQEPRRLAPLAQVLVDQAEVVEGHDQSLGVLDPPERRRPALQPVDRFLRAPQTGERDTDRHGHLRDRAMVIRPAQLGVGILRIAEGATRGAQLVPQGTDLRSGASPEPRAGDATREIERAPPLAQRLLQPTAELLDLGDAKHEAHALLERVGLRFPKSVAIRLERVRVRVRGEVKVADRLLLRDPRRAGTCGSGIRGDRSLHVQTSNSSQTRWVDTGDSFRCSRASFEYLPGQPVRVAAGSSARLPSTLKGSAPPTGARCLAVSCPSRSSRSGQGPARSRAHQPTR